MKKVIAELNDMIYATTPESYKSNEEFVYGEVVDIDEEDGETIYVLKLENGEECVVRNEDILEINDEEIIEDDVDAEDFLEEEDDSSFLEKRNYDYEESDDFWFKKSWHFYCVVL